MSQKLAFFLRFLFVSVLGVFLHFAYDFSDQNIFVGFFSSVNESTWEHLKLFFYPMLLLTFWESLKHRYNLTDLTTHLSARTLALLSGMAFIAVVFYTFWGISGKLIDFVNISIFFLGTFFAFYIEQIALKKPLIFALYTAFVLWSVLWFLFLIFTYSPPDFGLFYDLSLHPKG